MGSTCDEARKRVRGRANEYKERRGCEMTLPKATLACAGWVAMAEALGWEAAP